MTTTPVWGNYLRISEDPHDIGNGVNRQQQDTREAVEKHGGTITKTYRENDTSAYKKRKVRRRDEAGNEYHAYRVIRPVWQKALTDLRSGVIDALMVWDIDRLARDPRDLEDAIEVVEYYGKRIEGATGSINLMTDDGRAMARVMVAMANKSSADTARRVKRAHVELARTGAAIGGTRPFGWNSDKVTINPSEAQLVRSAVERLLAGDATMHGIAREWNKLGITTTKGNKWDQVGIRQYLGNARLVGQREYEGKHYLGQWEPMIEKATWERLQAFFAVRAIGKGTRPAARRFLLSGIVRCGTCAGSMYGNMTPIEGKHNYMCRGRSTGADHVVSVAGHRVDDLVVTAVLRKMSNAVVPTADEEWIGESRLVELRGEKAEALARMRAKTLSASAAMSMVEILETEEAELTAERAAWLRRTSGPSQQQVTSESFDAMNLDARRELIAAWIKFVIVQPPTTRSRHFDPNRLDVIWQE